ncbi:MAG TPA: cell envelope integrity protein TolA [Burkholderiaceae bacterium]|nr:cell envelope integrity protein TolA [Burkholderiaceae bacterium]
MSAAPTPAGGQRPPRPPLAKGRARAVVLALAMHALLFGLLFVGLNWQSRVDEPVQAELWVPPPPAAPKPAPPPEPRPEPRAEPKPPPEPPAPPPKPEPPARAEVDIRAEQAKKEAERREAERREQDRRRAEEKRAEEKRAEEKRAEEKRAEDRRAEEKRVQERREQEKLAAERAAADRRAADEKRQREEQARREADKRAADDKRRRDEQARRDAELAEARRAEDIRRLQSQAGTSGTPSDTAVRGAASGGRVDAGYAAKVAGAIRSNTTYQAPADLEGNPKASFLVQLRPDCSVASVRLRRSSGVAAWDQAAERGIQRTDPFPRPPDGACQSEIEIVRGPRDER